MAAKSQTYAIPGILMRKEKRWKKFVIQFAKWNTRLGKKVNFPERMTFLNFKVDKF